MHNKVYFVPLIIIIIMFNNKRQMTELIYKDNGSGQILCNGCVTLTLGRLKIKSIVGLFLSLSTIYVHMYKK